jgi:hypothetical protein
VEKLENLFADETRDLSFPVRRDGQRCANRCRSGRSCGFAADLNQHGFDVTRQPFAIAMLGSRRPPIVTESGTTTNIERIHGAVESRVGSDRREALRLTFVGRSVEAGPRSRPDQLPAPDRSRSASTIHHGMTPSRPTTGDSRLPPEHGDELHLRIGQSQTECVQPRTLPAASTAIPVVHTEPSH